MTTQTTAVATVDRHQWATLKGSLYPGAADDSIKLVLSYCKARGLDPMKKPCHIVPIRAKDPDGEWRWRDVVFPGIYELRTTAQKTGDYMGQDDAEFGDTVDFMGVEVPSWCKITVYRWHDKSKTKISFSNIARFSEYAGIKKGYNDDPDSLNDRWSKAPFQMIEKCAEAGALRKAFPDELGGEYAVEEVDGQAFTDGKPGNPKAKPQTEAPRATDEPVTIEGEATEQAKPAPPQLATDKQVALIRAQLDQAGLAESLFLATYEIGVFEELPFSKVNDALAWIKKNHP